MDSARDSSVPAQLLAGTAIVVLVVVVSSVVLVELVLDSGVAVVEVASLLSFDEQLASRQKVRSAMMLSDRVFVRAMLQNY
jgi:hypothetical protein